MLQYEKFKHLTESTWITNTWKFVSEHEIKLKCDDSTRLTYPRKNDIKIMDAMRKLDCMSVKGQQSEMLLTGFNNSRCSNRMWNKNSIEHLRRKESNGK